MMRKPIVTGYAGVHDKLILDDNGGGTVEWQPGDGTRYVLTAKPLSDAEAELLGAPEGAMIVSVGPGESWMTLVLYPDGLHHISYVAEKAQRIAFNEYTVTACTVLLNLVMGDEAYGKHLFEQEIVRRG